MGRMNQGLQIALILFVIIAIALGITTFMYKKQAEEAAILEESATKQLATAQSQLTQRDDEIVELKQLIGYADTPLVDIRDRFDKMMALVAPGAEKPTYVSVIDSFGDQAKGLNDQIAELKKQVEGLQAQFKTREESKTAVIAAAEEKAKKAEEARKAQSEKDKKLLADIRKGQEDVRSVKDKNKKELAKIKSEARVKQEETFSQLQSKERKIEDLQKKIEETSRPPMDNPQGRLVYVAPNGSMGLIDLGKADGVTRGLTFSVYDPKDMSEQGKKGTIEVVAVEDVRKSEVRIYNADESFPVEVDDVIYTPIWQPGFKEHFALLGIMDIDNDNASDLETVRSLILRGGGVIDAYQRDDGSQEGNITSETTWVIRGIAPDDKSPEAEQITYTNMNNAAEKFNVREMKLSELLRKMGYRPSSEAQKQVGRQYGKTKAPREETTRRPPSRSAY
ncbi:MAG: hypothetical protein Q4D98_12800 [Planctomycetia bacterium]|nr:hypothetical protein [Planctomycetia bacterium]